MSEQLKTAFEIANIAASTLTYTGLGIPHENLRIILDQNSYDKNILYIIKLMHLTHKKIMMN